MSNPAKTETMPKREHLLTLVEPTTGGDNTLDVAKETAARGGDVSVVMVITDRVRRDICDYAKSEDLDHADAEELALGQLQSQCSSRVGGSPRVMTHFGPVRSNVVRYVTPETTAIAVPERLAAGNLAQLLTVYTGLPVIVTPSRAA